MCAGAIINARIPKLIYACPDPKAGAIQSLFHSAPITRLNHRVEIQTNVLKEECTTSSPISSPPKEPKEK